MIVFNLSCDNAHRFEGWFGSADDFTSQADAGSIACPVCGSGTVQKEMMAPAVRPGRKPAARVDLSQPGSEVEAALVALKKQIEANSEYVGMNFETEARRIHQGEAPERAIHGEAKPEQARRMIEDGLPVAPLPFVPGRKVN